MMKTSLAIALFLMIGLNALSQDQIFTDRPNVTDAVVLLPKGTLQVELGYFRQSDESGDVMTSTHPNINIKYGLADWLEIRALTNYQTTDISLDGGDLKLEGITPLTISPKIRVLKPNGLVPRLTVAANMALPDLASEDFQNEDINYGYRMLMEYTFNRISWSSGIGTDWGGDRDTSWGYSSALSTALGKKTATFIELYGNFGNDLDTSIAFDTGLLYLINDDIQIDIAFGFGLNDDAAEGFIALGFAWRTAL